MSPNEEFLQRSGVVEVLFISVDGDRHGPFHTKMRDSIEGVVARAAAPDDENAGVRDALGADLHVHERGRSSVDGVVF